MSCLDSQHLTVIEPRPVKEKTRRADGHSAYTIKIASHCRRRRQPPMVASYRPLWMPIVSAWRRSRSRARPHTSSRSHHRYRPRVFFSHSTVAAAVGTLRCHCTPCRWIRTPIDIHDESGDALPATTTITNLDLGQEAAVRRDAVPPILHHVQGILP